MVSFSINRESIRRIIRQLREIGEKYAKQTCRKAVDASTRVLYTATKPEIPVLSGALQKSLKMRAGPKRRGRITKRLVTGLGFFRGSEYHGGFVHFGHRVGSRKLGDSRTLVPPDPFMERGFAKGWKAARDAAMRVLIEGIRAMMNR